MACYISAGHHKKDPGAQANGLKEADLTVRVRDRVIEIIQKINETPYRVIKDNDDETLAEYLKRIKPGEGSVVVEFHFDAAANPDATGTSAYFADGGDVQHLRSKQFAADLTTATARILGIRDRGAHSETESHRGRLGLVHEVGINCLVEVCFITNSYDIQKFNEHFEELCQEYAKIIIHYDDIIK
jgi:N-acetylmuramoyl-L-alanine amidase